MIESGLKSRKIRKQEYVHKFELSDELKVSSWLFACLEIWKYAAASVQGV